MSENDNDEAETKAASPKISGAKLFKLRKNGATPDDLKLISTDAEADEVLTYLNSEREKQEARLNEKAKEAESPVKKMKLAAAGKGTDTKPVQNQKPAAPALESLVVMNTMAYENMSDEQHFTPGSRILHRWNDQTKCWEVL